MYTKSCIIGLVMILINLYPVPTIQAADKVAYTAAEVLTEVNKILALDDIRAETLMSVCREDASIRQYRLRIMSSGSDKVFAEIIQPKQFRGRQLLRLNDAVWAYFPNRSSQQNRSSLRVKRAIRVSGRDKFMGGDFTNNDVLRLNYMDDYTPTIIEDLADQYILELKGKDQSVTYPFLRFWIRKGDFQPIKQEIYSLSDELVKSVFYQDYRDFGGGFIRPGMLEVKSAIIPKSKTFFEIIYLKRDAKNPDKRFLKSNLGK